MRARASRNEPRLTFLLLSRTLLAVAALILLAMAGLAYWNWQHYRSARASGIQLLAVQRSVESLTSALLDAESSERGFLLTGDARYLDPYNRGIDNALREVAQLRELPQPAGSDSPAQVERLNFLVALKISELRQAVDLRRGQGKAPASAILPSDQGRQAMDEIRDICSAIRGRIASQRTGNQTRALTATSGSLLVTTLGSLMLLALLIAGAVVIDKRTRERERTLAGMRGLHDLGLRLMQQHDLHSLLDEILGAAKAITAADMGSIQLLDDNRVLRIEAQHGFNPAFLDFFREVRAGDASASATALERGEQIVVADVERSPIFAGTPALPVLLRQGVRAAQSTPMISRTGNLVGVLATHYRTPQIPPDEDLRLLDLLARQAADLIEKHRADEALRESEERYRATFDNAAVGIAHVGLDGRWLRFNDAVCAITGYSREELSARKVDDITHAEELPACWAQIRRVLDGEIPACSMEKRYIGKDGASVWVNLTVSLLRDASGAPLYFVSVLEDIGQRKQSEQELRTTKEQLQLVADRMAAAVSRCSRDLRYLWVSRGYAAWLGRAPEEIAGRPIDGILGADGFQIIRPYIDQVLSGKRVEYASQVSFNGLGQRWIRAVYVPTYAPDQAVDGWIAVVADITEERRAADQLRQSQRLESLGVLAGGIAHDFNNLLVGVMGNASLALEMLGPATRASKLLEDLIKASERAAGLTRQLLVYAGKEMLTTKPVDPSRLIADMAGLLKTSIPKNVDLAFDFQPSLPALEADPIQLQQVIMNLVINAAEAIPPEVQGTVRIAASTREPGGEDLARTVVPLPANGRSYVAITVADNGHGMTPEVQSRIFDPFFTTKFTGRGLGLSAVLGIVKAHEGGIALKSEPGAGTEFILLFPSAAAAARLDPPASLRPFRGTGTVLVVDDEQSVRDVARLVLEFYGYETMMAENGQDAIHVFASHPEIVAIILDLAMPVMSGEQAAPRLRSINPDIPIILSSGHPEAEARQKFAGIGISSFLHKPYRPADLIARLQASLGARSKPVESSS